MKRIWIVRHAESKANAGQVTETPANVELTNTGWKQAKQLSQKLPIPDLIVTSSYLRTQQTAADLVRETQREPEIWPMLHEFTYLSPVKFKNTSIADRNPYKKNYWSTCDPNDIAGEGAESFNQFMDRVQRGLNLMLNTPHDFIAVVSHGQYIKGLMWLLMAGFISDDSSDRMRKIGHFMEGIPIPNTGILELVVDSQVSMRFKTDHIEHWTY